MEQSNCVPPTTFIYALVDPRTNRVRYVGKADDPQKRLGMHLFEATHDAYCPNKHKGNWLRLLIREDRPPLLQVLEETPSATWQERECFWIAEMKRRGEPLLNATDGGEGATPNEETREKLRQLWLGRKHTEETKAKQSAAHKGRVFSEESRAKMSASQKGKKHGPLSPERRAQLGEMSRTRQRSPSEFEHLKRQSHARRARLGITDPVVVKVPCTFCGALFERKSKRIRKHPTGRVFCCVEHAYEYRRAQRPQASCAWCGAALKRTAARLNYVKMGLFFCNNSHAALYRHANHGREGFGLK